MTKSTEILEALRMQPLTEEEKASRHILGRWYGPIATCNESTRNGRRYNRELWERALNDELFHEKIANKCLFLELGHPQDREETDMSKVCACIPEMPKIIDGDLCACVDILDTPNGKILKTLCDYGFVPGISSRGSGDVMPNNDVDPETFFLECFDVVAIPAVKKARLNMCESLDKNVVNLKKALTESINKASEEDKAIMKETLENLDIDIEASEVVKEELVEKKLSVDEIPWDPEENPEALTEDTENEEEAEDEVASDEAAETDEVDSDETEAIEEIPEDTSDEVPEDQEEVIVDVDSAEEATINTVADAIEQLQEYDDDTEVQFEPIEIDGKEYNIDKLETFVDEKENILVVGVNCEEAEETSDDTDSNIDTQTEDEEISVEDSDETDDTEPSAEDTGDEEVIESLKEMIRQKEALETEVSDLRKAKSVGDAKETELQEKLNRYRTAFRTTSAEAAKVPELQSRVKELTEQLTQAQNNVKVLTEKVNKAQQLKESIEGNKANERRLNEEVSRLTKRSEALEAKLEGQTKQFTTKLQERTDLAKKYKARFIETLTRYVESKASMLGVKPSEITSRLNESYTLADVDAVCNEILESTAPFGRLPFGGRTKAAARITESVSNKTTNYDDDDLSSLYELAGLKR
jgi:hypothetical protein